MKMKRMLMVAVTAGILLSGCATKEKDTLQPSKKEIKSTFSKLNKRSTIVPGYQTMEVKKYVSVQNGITLQEAIDKLNQFYGTNYFYNGENIVLPKSNFKIYTPKDLKYYVDTTTDYQLIISPDYKKNKIVKVYLLPKGINENYHYFVAGKTKFLQQLYKLKKAGFNLAIKNGVGNPEINIYIDTKNPYKFLKQICKVADVWCDLKSDKTILVQKTKLFTFTVDKDGALSYSVGNAQNSDSGMDSGGGENGGTQISAGGGATGGTDSGQIDGSMGYSVSSMSYAKFMGLLTQMFDKVDSYIGKNGYITFNVTPHQYETINNYFQEKNRRKELVAMNVSIYRIDLKDEFQYGVNWDLFTDFIFKGINGLKIVNNSAGQDMSPLNNTGGFIEFRNDKLKKQIEDYIAKNPDLTLDEINQLRQYEYTGIIRALEQFGKVYKVDNFSNIAYTGEYIPFGNYENIKFFTIGSTGGDNPEPTTELHSQNVGFQGSLMVQKVDDGYNINGIVKESVITGYAEVTTQFGTIKAPNTAEKLIRIKTHLSNLNRSIILGGFVIKGVDKSHSFIPYAGNVPIMGNLFKNKNDVTTNSEFIVVITLQKAEEGKIK